jgi:hypothetical protein
MNHAGQEPRKGNAQQVSAGAQGGKDAVGFMLLELFILIFALQNHNTTICQQYILKSISL